jgi:hypothetical protein
MFSSVFMGSGTLFLPLQLPLSLPFYILLFIDPDEISHTAGSATVAKELTRHKIEENVGTAAAVLCTLSRQRFMDDVVGIVALLGTVEDRNMSR